MGMAKTHEEIDDDNDNNTTLNFRASKNSALHTQPLHTHTGISSRQEHENLVIAFGIHH